MIFENGAIKFEIKILFIFDDKQNEWDLSPL